MPTRRCIGAGDLSKGILVEIDGYAYLGECTKKVTPKYWGMLFHCSKDNLSDLSIDRRITEGLDEGVPETDCYLPISQDSEIGR